VRRVVERVLLDVGRARHAVPSPGEGALASAPDRCPLAGARFTTATLPARTSFTTRG
jgi:hypothetical protein